MTLRSLAERLKSIGRPLSADALNKIENGRLLEGGEEKPRAIRRVDADDLVALSVALGVNVSALLLPLTDSATEVVSVTGIGEISAARAWDWADGQASIEAAGSDDPAAAILQFQIYARPAGRRLGLRPSTAEELAEMRRTIGMKEGAQPDGTGVD